MEEIFHPDTSKKTLTKTIGGKIFLTLLAIIFILLTSFGILVGYYSVQIKFGSQEELADRFYSEKFTSDPSASNPQAQEIDIDPRQFIREHNPTFGPDDAPITIIAFIDFECPFCKVDYAQFKELINRYESSIQVVFKQYPLEVLHSNSTEMALLSQCAHEQNKFISAYDHFFTDPEFAGLTLAGQAEHLNIDEDQYTSCVQDNKYSRQIEQDIADGMRLQVAGTPTYFVNQTKIQGVVDANTWNQILIDQIKQALVK